MKCQNSISHWISKKTSPKHSVFPIWQDLLIDDCLSLSLLSNNSLRFVRDLKSPPHFRAEKYLEKRSNSCLIWTGWHQKWQQKLENVFLHDTLPTVHCPNCLLKTFKTNAKEVGSQADSLLWMALGNLSKQLHYSWYSITCCLLIPIQLALAAPDMPTLGCGKRPRFELPQQSSTAGCQQLISYS